MQNLAWYPITTSMNVKCLASSECNSNTFTVLRMSIANPLLCGVCGEVGHRARLFPYLSDVESVPERAPGASFQEVEFLTRQEEPHERQPPSRHFVTGEHYGNSTQAEDGIRAAEVGTA